MMTLTNPRVGALTLAVPLALAAIACTWLVLMSLSPSAGQPENGAPGPAKPLSAGQAMMHIAPAPVDPSAARFEGMGAASEAYWRWP